MSGNGQDKDGFANSEAVLIIPAYNEEENLSAVLDTAKCSPLLKRIIVIDDGSDDRTAEIAESFEGVEVIRQSNRGKAGAMEAGVNASDEALLLFLDADLRGLTLSHIEDLIHPVADGDCDMTMGLFYGPPHPSRWAHRLSPGLSGQRAMHRNVLDLLEDYGSLGFGIETAFTKLVNRNMISLKTVRLEGVSQVMKEEKHGFIAGAKLRARMFYEIVRTRFSRPYKR